MTKTTDWPFKGKPHTNGYIRGVLITLGVSVALTCLITATGPTLLILLVFLLFLLLRTIGRDIKKEWSNDDNQEH